MVDPRTPVLIGAGQLSNRVDRGADVLEPVDLIVEALRRAAEDAGAGDAALTGADAVHTVGLLSWRYRDPAALVGERVGATPDGHVGHRHGRQRAAVAREPHLPRHPAGRRRPRPPRRGRGVAHPDGRPVGRRRPRLDACRTTTVPEAPRSIPEVPMSSPGEQARGLMMPVQVYPLFEQAHRDRARPRPRRAPRRHVRAVGRVQRGGRRQPARLDPGGVHRRGDPHAVARQPDDRLPVHEAAELQQRGRAGRRGDPVLGRAGRSARRAARPLGVPAQRHRRPRPLLRVRARRPRTLARHARRRARVASSWPASASTTSPTSTSTRASRRRWRSPPTSSASALDRPLTVTGGLSFAGGPWNNYVTHSIATMADRLRDEPGIARPRQRQRRVHHQARLRRVRHRAAGHPVPARRRAGRGRRAAQARALRGPRRRGRHRDVDRDARPRRQPGDGHRGRPARRRPPRHRHHPGRRRAEGRSSPRTSPAAARTSRPTARPTLL